MNLSKKKIFPVTILRLFQVYGPKQETNRIIPFLIKSCIKNKKFPTTKGNQLCDFCYVDDVIKAIFKTLISKTTNGEIINIGSGEPLQIKKIIRITTNLIGKGKPNIGSLDYKKNTNMRNFPSIVKAKKKLNWKPIIKIVPGIKKTISSFQ